MSTKDIFDRKNEIMESMNLDLYIPLTEGIGSNIAEIFRKIKKAVVDFFKRLIQGFKNFRDRLFNRAGGSSSDNSNDTRNQETRKKTDEEWEERRKRAEEERRKYEDDLKKAKEEFERQRRNREEARRKAEEEFKKWEEEFDKKYNSSTWEDEFDKAWEKWEKDEKEKAKRKEEERKKREEEYEKERQRRRKEQEEYRKKWEEEDRRRQEEYRKKSEERRKRAEEERKKQEEERKKWEEERKREEQQKRQRQQYGGFNWRAKSKNSYGFNKFEIIRKAKSSNIELDKPVQNPKSYDDCSGTFEFMFNDAKDIKEKFKDIKDYEAFKNNVLNSLFGGGSETIISKKIKGHLRERKKIKKMSDVDFDTYFEYIESDRIINDFRKQEKRITQELNEAERESETYDIKQLKYIIQIQLKATQLIEKEIEAIMSECVSLAKKVQNM